MAQNVGNTIVSIPPCLSQPDASLGSCKRVSSTNVHRGMITDTPEAQRADPGDPFVVLVMKKALRPPSQRSATKTNWFSSNVFGKEEVEEKCSQETQ